MKHKIIGVAVIVNEEKTQVLIDRRLPRGSMAGLWEFPGGKLEPGESVQECIFREVKEEIGIDIEVGNHLVTIHHEYSDFHVTLIVHLCRYLKGEPKTIECQEVRWVDLGELPTFNFPEANYHIITTLQTMLM